MEYFTDIDFGKYMKKGDLSRVTPPGGYPPKSYCGAGTITAFGSTFGIPKCPLK